MFTENKILNVSKTIKVGEDVEDAILNLHKIDMVNSFIVYGVYADDKLIAWNINFNVSQTDAYNTISKQDIIEHLDKHLYASINGEKKYVICYMQPQLDLLIKLYKPLIIHLAKEQHHQWKYLEIEDLVQMCNLVICDLYYKGYYVHKRLIRRAYINYVLMHIRKDKNKPTTISFEQEYYMSDDDDAITVENKIPDNTMVEELDDKYTSEVDAKVLNEMKQLVIDFIGPRQYDQLLREYSNKSTTAWSRKLMTTIKAHMFELGINVKSFNKYYN